MCASVNFDLFVVLPCPAARNQSGAWNCLVPVRTQVRLYSGRREIRSARCGGRMRPPSYSRGSRRVAGRSSLSRAPETEADLQPQSDGRCGRCAPPAIRAVQAAARMPQCATYYRIILGAPPKHADAPYAVALLRARRQRARCRAPKTSDELPPSHPSSPHVWP
jgi:hypothetical protein